MRQPKILNINELDSFPELTTVMDKMGIKWVKVQENWMSDQLDLTDSKTLSKKIVRSYKWLNK